MKEHYVWAVVQHHGAVTGVIALPRLPACHI
jgi:hypothetical protein